MSEMPDKINFVPTESTKEDDVLFENIYKHSYDSRFLPKEICRKCYDTAVQMSHSDDETRWFYDDIVDFAINILNIKRS